MPARYATGGRLAACLLAAVVIALWLLAAATPLLAGSLQGTGVVFLHGKAVWSGMFDGGIPAALEAEGALVASPNMPWSFIRMYGATYDDALREIDAAVADLKSRGATRVVVIGHSLGANAAIGYAARRSGVAAVVAISPGHLPETSEMRARTADAIVEARRLQAAGDTARHAWPDQIQGVPTFRDGDALGLSQPVRSGRPRRNSEECSSAAQRAAVVGGRQFRPDRHTRPRLRVFAGTAKSQKPLYRSFGRTFDDAVGRAIAGRRMAEIAVNPGRRKRVFRLPEIGLSR